MASWLHTTVLATVLAATAAIGLASATMVMQANEAAPKADRLPIVADAEGYMTIETRQDGVSVLNRIQVR
jgi:hypothetical protein